MGNFISWINKNLPQDDSQGEAREEKPQSLSGQLLLLRDTM